MRTSFGMRRDLPSFGLLTLAVVAALSPAVASAQISTVAGTGVGGFSGDGALATSAAIDGPRGVAWMPDGGFVFADFRNERIRRVSPTGLTTTLAGTGATCLPSTNPCGDGGPATQAQFNFVHGPAVLGDGSVVIADMLDNRIRRVDAQTGVITTVAGTGARGSSGDGGRATAAAINTPRGVATRGSDIFIPDSDNGLVRRVDGTTGVISTVAGGGAQAPPVAGGASVSATGADLGLPFSVGPTSDGGLLIADQATNEIDRVWPDGRITRVAGQGVRGDVVSSGDGGPASAAALSKPHSVVEVPGGPLAGGFLIAEMPPVTNPSAFPDNRIRYVGPDGTISTVVNGSGIADSSGDGGPALTARINGPRGLAIRPDGTFLIAEFGPPDFAQAGGDRVRLVTPDAPGTTPPPSPSPSPTVPTATPTPGAPTPTPGAPVPPSGTPTAPLPGTPVAPGAGTPSVPSAKAPFAIVIPSRNRRIAVSAQGRFRFAVGPHVQASTGTLVVERRGRGTSRSRRLAAASLRVRGGSVATAKLRLGPAARRLLARRRSLAARATVRLAPAGRQATVRRFDLVLVRRR